MTGQVRNSNVDHIPGVSGAPLPPDARWQNVQLFAGLDPEATAAIAARLQLHTFAPGDVLIREGRPCGELFILRSGVMQVSRTPNTVDIATIDDDENPALHDVLLRRLVAGDCFGEMSLITGALPSATVRALTDGEAWALGAADFTALASGYPSLARNINIILSERLLYTTRQQSGSPPQHVIVAIAAPSPFLDALARSLSGYSADDMLHVDFGAMPEEFRTAHTLEDLRSGRVRFTQAEPGAFNRTVVRVRGTDATDGVAATDIADLLVGLKRLEESCRRILVTVPPERSNLTGSLLPFAQHILIVGSIHSPGTVRSLTASLPIRSGLGIRPALGIVLTDASPAVIPTEATLEGLTGLVGAPVRAVIPELEARQGAAIDALGRWVTGQQVGIALGAGGAKGWAHFGVLRVLMRARVPFDCISGASIGSMIAAGLAAGASVDEFGGADGTRRHRRLPPHVLTLRAAQ